MSLHHLILKRPTGEKPSRIGPIGDGKPVSVAEVEVKNEPNRVLNDFV